MQISPRLLLTSNTQTEHKKGPLGPFFLRVSFRFAAIVYKEPLNKFLSHCYVSLVGLKGCIINLCPNLIS